jgi:hypothetical protein
MTTLEDSSDASQGVNRIVHALLPDKCLASVLNSQAQQAVQTWNSITTMFDWPYAMGLGGAANLIAERKISLFDVASILHSKYTQATSMQYGATEKVYAHSYLEGHRVRQVQQQRLTMGMLVKASLSGIRSACQPTKHSADDFRDSAREFENMVAVIEGNLLEFDKKVQTLDGKINYTDARLRGQTITQVADVVALSFGIGCLGIVLGLWGPGGTALRAKLIAVAGTTAGIIKTVIGSSKQEDVVILVQSLKRVNREAQ